MIYPRRLPGLLYTNRYTVYSILILVCTFIYFLFKWNLLCTNLQAWQHVKKMCRLYDQGIAVGSLCGPLCTTNDIHSLTCHSFQATKEAVFSAELHNTRLVFKSASTDYQSLHWYDNGELQYPSEKEFLTTIRAIVRNKLNLTLAHDTAVRLSRLKPSYQERNLAKRQREMDNLWILVQDNEYLISTIFSDRDMFPEVLGTCGPYFAVEFLEHIPGTSALLTVTDSREDWSTRLKISVLIIDLLNELETNFREPFHLCDVKLEHFGIVADKSRLKFVDLDSVYPKSTVNRIIKSTESCERDEDCDFYDCRARCNTNTKLCNEVSNNNIQVVCEKIFLGWRMSNTVIVPGLLMSQHTPSDLATLLRLCANPHGEEGKPRGATDHDTRKRLRSILLEIEHSVNNDYV